MRCAILPLQICCREPRNNSVPELAGFKDSLSIGRQTCSYVLTLLDRCSAGSR